MCQSRAQGGKRCYAHSAGVRAKAAFCGLATATSDLDSEQVEALYERLKKSAQRRQTQAPSLQAVRDENAKLSMQIRHDDKVAELTRHRLLRHLAEVEDATENGQLPGGPAFAAQREIVAQARMSQMQLGALLEESARAQRCDPERLAAKFRYWRNRSDHEDMESPDPAFRLAPGDVDDPSATFTHGLPDDVGTRRALRKLGLENYLAQREPVFVYGTLRSGQSNSGRFSAEGTDEVVAGRVDGVAVYGPNRGFPYAQPAPDGRGHTVGEMVTLHDTAAGDHVRASLDGLEGFDSDTFSQSHYYRELRPVTFVDRDGRERTRKAWVYLAGSWAAEGLSEDDRIHSGDWVMARHRPDPAPSYGRYVPAQERQWWEDVEPSRPLSSVPSAGSARDSAAVFAQAFNDSDEHAGFLASMTGDEPV